MADGLGRHGDESPFEVGGTAGKGRQGGTEFGAMVGQVDQQRAVVAGTGAPVQHTPITVQLDGEAESGCHPPDGGMPRHQHDDQLCEGQQQRVALPQVLRLVCQHEPLLRCIPAQQPPRHHDLGLRHPDHGWPGVAGDAHGGAEHRADGPVPTLASVAPVHAGEEGQHSEAGGRPRQQHPAIDVGRRGVLPARPGVTDPDVDARGQRLPAGAQCIECVGRRWLRWCGRGRDHRLQPVACYLALRPHRRRDAQAEQQGKGTDPRPAGGPSGAAERRLGAESRGRQEHAQHRDLCHPPGDHGASPSRSASSRRIRSSSARLSLSSETKCAKSFSAEPWKIDSRTRARALSPACSAATMARYR